MEEVWSETSNGVSTPVPPLDVQGAYTGKVVLLTGCTGFLGSLVLEKLLWECGDRLSHIYCIIRPEGSRDGEERLSKEVLSSPIFSRLRARHRNSWPSWAGNKLTSIDGDLGRDELGLEASVLELLSSTVDVVLHTAADRHGGLNTALSVNTIGSLELLHICGRGEATEAKSKVAFVFVSDAYVAAAQVLHNPNPNPNTGGEGFLTAPIPTGTSGLFEGRACAIVEAWKEEGICESDHTRRGHH